MLMAGRRYDIEEDVDVLDQDIRQDNLEVDEVKRILKKFADDSEWKLDEAYEEQVAVESDEAKPTEATLKYATRQKEAFADEQKENKISLRNRIIIGVYIAAILALILAIAITNAKITGSMVEYNTLSEEKNVLSGEIDGLLSDIGEIERLYDVEAVAKELGFFAPDELSSKGFIAPEQREALTYTTDKTFFDAICDFLSGLFGTK